jgi:hypothetical protein
LCKIGLPFAATRIVTLAFGWSVAWAIAFHHGPAIGGVVGTVMQIATAVGAPLAAFRFVIRPKLVQLWALRDRAALQQLSIQVSLVAVGFVVLTTLLASHRGVSSGLSIIVACSDRIAWRGCNRYSGRGRARREPGKECFATANSNDDWNAADYFCFGTAERFSGYCSLCLLFVDFRRRNAAVGDKVAWLTVSSNDEYQT